MISDTSLHALGVALQSEVLILTDLIILLRFPRKDHVLVPAGLPVLQRVPAVPGLRSPAESAAAAALRHHCRPPPGNLPEAAVGPSATARGPSQPVSRGVQSRRWLLTPLFTCFYGKFFAKRDEKSCRVCFLGELCVWERLQVCSSYNQLIIGSLFVPTFHRLRDESV